MKGGYAISPREPVEVFRDDDRIIIAIIPSDKQVPTIVETQSDIIDLNNKVSVPNKPKKRRRKKKRPLMNDESAAEEKNGKTQVSANDVKSLWEYYRDMKDINNQDIHETNGSIPPRNHQRMEENGLHTLSEGEDPSPVDDKDEILIQRLVQWKQ